MERERVCRRTTSHQLEPTGHPTDQQKHLHWMPTMCPHTGSFRCSKQGGLLATSWYAAHRLRRQASTNKSAMEHRHSRDCFERWHSLSSGRAFGLSDGCTRPAPEVTSSRVLMCRVTTPMFATSNVRPLCSCMSSRTAASKKTRDACLPFAGIVTVAASWPVSGKLYKALQSHSCDSAGEEEMHRQLSKKLRRCHSPWVHGPTYSSLIVHQLRL